MKKRGLVIFIVIILFLSGFGILGKTYYDYRNSRQTENQLLSEFDKIVEENKKSVEILEIPVDIPELPASNPEVNMTPEEEVNLDANDPLAEEEEVDPIDYSKYGKYTIVAKIEIPSIDVIDIILEGTSLKLLKVGLGHFPETVGPGEQGNFSVCGHSGGRLGIFFKDLVDVENGDEIIITDTEGNVYKYEAYDKFIIEPTDFSVLDNPTDDSSIVTLITCTPGGKQRQIVRGKLISDEE